MSDGGQITVELIAKIDQLTSGLNTAVTEIRTSTNDIRGSLKGVGEGGKEMDGLLKTVLSGAAFLEFQAIAKEALDGVKEAFESTVGKAMEFGLENAKFAALMGSSTQQAAGLAASLESVGVSLHEYEQLALRMQMRMKSQEEAFNAMGMATRDSNGQLMQGEALMNSAISAMQTYKVGTDQNSFALQVFGRRAEDIYDIMRLTSVEQAHYAQDMADLGVNSGDTAQSVIELEAALNRQKQQWDDIWLVIGQRVMPVLTEFVNWANTEGKPALIAIRDGVILVIDVFITLGTIFLEVGTVIGGVLAAIMDWVVGWGEVWVKVVHGDFAGAAERAKGIFTDLGETFHNTIERMKAEAQGAQKIIDALTNPAKPKEEANPYAKGGNRSFVPYDANAGKEAQKLADERLRSDEQLALQRVKIEEDVNAQLLAMGQRTSDEFASEAERLEDKKYEIQRDYLEKKAQVDARDKLAHLKDLDQLKALEGAHEEAVLKIHDQAAQRKMQQQKREAQEFIEDKDNELSVATDRLEQEYKMGLLTAAEKAATEKQLTVAIIGQEIARLDAERDSLKKGTDAWNENMRQRLKLTQDMAKQVTKIDSDLASDERQKWTTLANSIRSSFNGAINGMILGTMTWQRALGQIIDGVASAFLDMGEKILEDWIMVQIEKAVVSKSTESVSAASQIAANAAVAGSGAFAAIAAIPFVGPAMAPGAAAAAYAGALSFEGLAFAEQGMLLDRDRLVFAHKDEQILPSHLSKGMQNLINGGGGSGKTELNYSPTINAPQHRSLDQMLTDESSTMVSWLNARMRDGSLKARS